MFGRVPKIHLHWMCVQLTPSPDFSGMVVQIVMNHFQAAQFVFQNYGSILQFNFDFKIQSSQ